LAAFLQGITKVPKDDWATLMKNPKVAKQTLAVMEQDLKFETAKVAGQIPEGTYSPAKRRLLTLAKGSIERWNTKIQGEYEQVFKDLDRSGLLDERSIQVQPFVDQFTTHLQKAGLVSPAGDLLVSSAKAREAGVMQKIAGAKGRNTLLDVYQDLKAMAGHSEHMTVRESKELTDKLGNLIRAGGGWNGGDLAISEESIRLLKDMRGALRQGQGMSLVGKQVMTSKGQKVAADAYHNGMMGRFSKFRGAYEEFIPVGEGSEKGLRKIEKLLGQNGEELESKFVDLATAVGEQASPVIERMKVLRAGNRMAKYYTPASFTDFGSNVVSLGSKTPYVMARRVGGNKYLTRNQNVKLPPLSPQTDIKIQAKAKALNMLKEHGSEGISTLLSSPKMMQELYEAMNIGEAAYEETSAELEDAIMQGLPQQ
jgi:hypothetical protein